MEKHKKCHVLSKIKPGEINLYKGDKELNLRGYSCSKLMTSVNVLLQGGWINSQYKRKPLITAILMDTGTLISKDKYFLLKSSTN